MCGPTDTQLHVSFAQIVILTHPVVSTVLRSRHVLHVVSSSNLKTVKKNTKDIWTEDEVTAGAEFDDTDDPREQPQSVTLQQYAAATTTFNT